MINAINSSVEIKFDMNGNIYKDKEFVGITGANLTGTIFFTFLESDLYATPDIVKKGEAILEYSRLTDDEILETGFIPIGALYDHTGEQIGFAMPIKSSLLKYKGNLNLQLHITNQFEESEEIEVYKSKIFNLYVAESINATKEIPDEYPNWIDEINVRLQEMDNLDIKAERVSNGVEVISTSKTGVESRYLVHDGEKGEQGERGLQGFKGDKGEDGAIQYEAGSTIRIDNNIVNAELPLYKYEFSEFPTTSTIITDEEFISKLEGYIFACSNAGILKDKRPRLAVMLVNSWGGLDPEINQYLEYTSTENVSYTSTHFFFIADHQIISPEIYSDGTRRYITYGIRLTGHWNNDTEKKFIIDECRGVKTVSLNTVSMLTPNYYQAGERINIEDRVISYDDIPTLTATDSSIQVNSITDETFLNKLTKSINEHLNKKERVFARVVVDYSQVNNFGIQTVLYCCDQRIRNTTTTYTFKAEYPVISYNINTSGYKDITRFYLEVKGTWTDNVFSITSCTTKFYSTSDGIQALVCKETLEKYYQKITGYDATKTQTLKNVNGVLTWVSDTESGA